MELFGYSLLDENNNEVWHQGDTIGQLQSIPEPLILPNGDSVHCAEVGATYDKWKFVGRYVVNNPPSKWHAEIRRDIAYVNGNIVVTVVYEAQPSIVPPSVSAMQARLALNDAGLLPQVEAAIAAADKRTQISWQYTNEFDRNHPLVLQVAKALNIADADMDNLFRRASDLQ